MKHNSNQPKVTFRERVFRFMYGRNGADTLCNALLIAYLVIAVVNLFLQSWILSLAGLVLAIYALFRMMSRNLVKRQRENARFCGFWKALRGKVGLQKNKWRDRKTHVYRKCPHCKNTLRLPKIKGAHTVNCPCCHTRFDMTV